MSLFNTGVRALIDEYLLEQARQKRDYGEYWSASSAGYCMRKVIFTRLGVPAVTEDARKQRLFSAGHIFHAWIQGVTTSAGASIAQELELQDEDLMVRGHFDDIVEVDGKPILYDYKTVNSRSFMWAKKNGASLSHYHKLQLGTYMYMLRNGDFPQLEEARILKIEKDNLMMSEQQLMWSEELSSEVRDYWTTLNKYWKDKKIPPCTCADHENGFMAKEAYNDYFYNGQPCSTDWYNKWKEEEIQNATLQA